MNCATDMYLSIFPMAGRWARLRTLQDQSTRRDIKKIHYTRYSWGFAPKRDENFRLIGYTDKGEAESFALRQRLDMYGKQDPYPILS